MVFRMGRSTQPFRRQLYIAPSGVQKRPNSSVTRGAGSCGCARLTASFVLAVRMYRIVGCPGGAEKPGPEVSPAEYRFTIRGGFYCIVPDHRKMIR